MSHQPVVESALGHSKQLLPSLGSRSQPVCSPKSTPLGPASLGSPLRPSRPRAFIGKAQQPLRLLSRRHLACAVGPTVERAVKRAVERVVEPVVERAVERVVKRAVVPAVKQVVVPAVETVDVPDVVPVVELVTVPAVKQAVVPAISAVPEVTIHFAFKCTEDGHSPWNAGKYVFPIREDIVKSLMSQGKAMVSDRVKTTSEISGFLADDYEIHDVILGEPGQTYFSGPFRDGRKYTRRSVEHEVAILRDLLSGRFVDYAWLGPFDPSYTWRTFSVMTVVFKPRGKKMYSHLYDLWAGLFDE
jgi:hypothetical protein